MIKIKRGLNLPIDGQPEQRIEEGPRARTVAVLGGDYVGMRPTMFVREGEQVKKGQLLFTDKKTEGVKYTAPAGGTVSSINRGHKRVLLSVVIDVDDNAGEETFQSYSVEQLSNLDRQAVVDNLVESGLWTALRTRPFSKVPSPTSPSPNAIFVNAMDSNPLAANPSVVLAGQEEQFKNGLSVVARLTEGKTFLVAEEGSQVPTVNGVESETFSGPHPSGLVGTHIHFLNPVSDKKIVWHLNYQDVIAIGELFTTGKINSTRVVSLAGPQVEKPRLLKTQQGVSLEELTAGQLKTGENRVISGSVLSGVHAHGPVAFLGRYHLQVTGIREGRDRNFLEYLSPGADKHSVANIYLSKLNPAKLFSFTSTTNGSERAMVPIGSYEKLMPLDILPTQLLRSLVVNDFVTAIDLGALELDEEDLALCTYACPGKYEYGPILRDVLTTIEKEG